MASANLRRSLSPRRAANRIRAWRSRSRSKSNSRSTSRQNSDLDDQDNHSNSSRGSRGSGIATPAIGAVKRLLTGANNGAESSSKERCAKTSTQNIEDHASPETKITCEQCAPADSKLSDLNRIVCQVRELSDRSSVEPGLDRLELCCKGGDYNRLLKLFQLVCDLQVILRVAATEDSPCMMHMSGVRLNSMAIVVYGSDCTVTVVTNGAGVLFILQREGLLSMFYEGLHFDISVGDETNIDMILKAYVEMSLHSDVDDLKAILSSIKFVLYPGQNMDVIDDLNAGGLDIPGLRLTRPEFFSTRVLCMMLNADVYEQGFYKRYIFIDRLGTTFSAVREGETCSLSKISVLPDAMRRPVKDSTDILGEDLFMQRRKGRRDKFRLTCSVSVNVWEEYESPEWFGYIHPPPNADSMRPSNLRELKNRLESYGVPDATDVCRLVYHCLAHKSRNSNVKVDSLSAARSYFMYLKNFLKHGTTGLSVNHVVEGDEMAVVYDGIAYRVSSPQTELRHKSLFLSLVLSDERERNGKNIPRHPVLRRMCSTSEVVISICKDVTYLNAEFDEEGGTLYSAAAEEENLLEAWATCIALFVCDGYGCLEGYYNCAIENRRGSVVDEMAVFMNDVQVPVVFDKLFRKTSVMDELSGMSQARGATYPGAFISGRDQCSERTFLAGRSHQFVGSSLLRFLQRDLVLTHFQIPYVAHHTGVWPTRCPTSCCCTDKIHLISLCNKFVRD